MSRVSLVSSNIGPTLIGTQQVLPNTWNHYALTRSGNVITGFLNGVQDFQYVTSNTLDGSSGPSILSIGGAPSSNGGLVGYMDELRVSNVARYCSVSLQTSSFPSPVLYEYPPTSLTATASGTNPSSSLLSNLVYGNGIYTANASSNSVGMPAYMAFDKTSNEWFVSSTTNWASNGIYQGSGSQLISGTTFSGDWVSLQLPYPISLQSYLVTPGTHGFSSWVLAGSNDANTWTLVDTQYNVPVTARFALDGLSANALTNANGLFSCYRLLTSWTGPVVNIRRGSDSATLDFFADNQGNLWNSNVSLVSWVGSSNAYVTTWYDQSGKGHNAVQPTAAIQPQYNATLKLIDFTSPSVSSNVYMFMPSTTIPTNTVQSTVTHKLGKINATAAGVIFFTGGNGTGGSQYNTDITPTQYNTSQYGGSSTGGTVTAGDVGTWKFGGAGSPTQYFYLNGQESFASVGNPNNGSAYPAIPDTIGACNGSPGNTLGTAPLNSQLYFLSIFYTWLSAADTQVVEAQNYMPSQVAPVPVSVPPSPAYSSWMLLGTKGALGASSNTFVGVPQLSAGTSNVFAWPPSSIATGGTQTGNAYTTTLSGQSYGNGSYTSNSSSAVNSSCYAQYAFDKSTATFWSSGGFYSTSSPYRYTGTITTSDVLGNSYLGEWVSLQAPTAFTISNYAITVANANYSFQGPGTFWLLGSNDGNAWFLLDSRSGITWTSAYQVQTFTVTTSVPYSNYRLVINCVPGTNGTSSYTVFSELVFSSVQNYAPILQTGVVTGTTYAFPPASIATGGTQSGNQYTTLLTGQTFGNGTYTSNSSSYTGTNYAQNAFDKNTGSQWSAAASLYSSSSPYGVTSSTVTYDTLGNAYAGEWIQIQTPTPITINNYTINNNYASYGSQSPSKFWALGSNDGTSWYLVDSRTGVTWPSGATQTFTTPNVPPPYAWYRLVVNQINGTGGQLNITELVFNTSSIFTANTGGISELRLLSNTLVYEYPVSNLAVGVTSTGGNQYTTLVSNLVYGNGTYVCNASSYYTASGPLYPYNAFTKNVATSWASNVNAYSTTSPYQYTAGVYSTTAVGGTVCNGEWLQIQLPAPIVLSSYSLTVSSSNYQYQGPGAFYILGSNDGTTWYLLDYRSGINWVQPNQLQTFNVSASNAYTTYRMVVYALDGYLNTIVQVPVIAGWRLFTTQPLYEYPPSSLATGVSGTQPSTTVVTGQNYGNGTYVANASSVTSTFYAYYAFDKNVSTGEWASATAYSTSSPYGNTSSVVTTDVLGNVYGGEWLSLQSTTPFVLSSYAIWPANTSGAWATASPGTFYVLGSNDGTNWYVLDSRSGISWPTYSPQTFMLSSVPSAYSNYRLVTKLLSGNYGILCVVEWRLYTSLPLVGPPLPLTTVYPLDSLSSTALSSANGLFSTKRLLSKYQGPVVNLRRSTDSATLDFFADALGNLFNGRQTVQGWLAGATAYVTTWYDQSGQGNHATQATTSLQPTYNSNTRAVVLNSTYFQLPSLPSGNSPYTYTIKVSNVAFVSSYSIYVTGGNYVANQNIELFSTPTNVIHSWFSSDMTTATTATTNQFFTFSYDQTNRYTFLNGSLQTTLASSSHAQVNSNNYIGYDSRGYYSASSLTSISILSSNVSTSDRLIVEAQP